MAPRLNLQAKLVSILGSNNVYFQPPESIKLQYPCIIYKRDDTVVNHADDLPYMRRTRYLVTVIDRNPDSEIPSKIAALPMCIFDRFYTADNLNHDIYKLFF
jgi:hypothetical protein